MFENMNRLTLLANHRHYIKKKKSPFLENLFSFPIRMKISEKTRDELL